MPAVAHHGLLPGGLHKSARQKPVILPVLRGLAHLAAVADGNAVVSGQTRQSVGEHGRPYALALPTVGLIRQQLIHINGADLRICCGPRKRRWLSGGWVRGADEP